MTLPTADDRLEALFNERRSLDEQIGTLTAARDDCNARIRSAVGDARGVISAFGRQVFNVAYRRTLDQDEAMSRVKTDPDLLLRVIDTKISAPKLRVLAPDIYEACLVESTVPTITPKVA